MKQKIEGGKNKVPCDCPKGGLWENTDGSTTICDKCGGTEWITTTPIQETEKIETIVKITAPTPELERKGAEAFIEFAKSIADIMGEEIEIKKIKQ